MIFNVFRGSEITPCMTIEQPSIEDAVEAFLEGWFGGIDDGEVDYHNNQAATYAPSEEQYQDHSDAPGTTYRIAVDGVRDPR